MPVRACLVQAYGVKAETLSMQRIHLVRSTAADGVVARRFGSETLLVPVCAGVGDLDSVYTLNEVGTAIWETLAEPSSIDDLVTLLTAGYDVSGERARQDVAAYVADLTALGLVRQVAIAEDGAERARAREVRG
jgi:hypothetical protein